MAEVVIAVKGFLMMTPAISQGGLVFYTNQAAFNTAEPGLPVQSFNSANLYSQPFVYQPNGINSATSNTVFAAWSILPGLTISTLAPVLCKYSFASGRRLYHVKIDPHQAATFSA